MKKLSVVIPCYNEEEAVPLFYEAPATWISNQCTSRYKGNFLYVSSIVKNFFLYLTKRKTDACVNKLYLLTVCQTQILTDSR